MVVGGSELHGKLIDCSWWESIGRRMVDDEQAGQMVAGRRQGAVAVVVAAAVAMTRRWR